MSFYSLGIQNHLFGAWDIHARFFIPCVSNVPLHLLTWLSYIHREESTSVEEWQYSFPNGALKNLKKTILRM